MTLTRARLLPNFVPLQYKFEFSTCDDRDTLLDYVNNMMEASKLEAANTGACKAYARALTRTRARTRTRTRTRTHVHARTHVHIYVC